MVALRQMLFCLLLLNIQVALGGRQAVNSTELETLATNSTPTVSVPSTTTRRPLIQAINTIRLPCSCAQAQCGCCTGYFLDQLNQKACLNLTYEPEDFSVTASMYLNGVRFYKNSISGKNPPPMCIRLPRFRFVRFCVEFYNVYFLNRNMHLCINADANWEDFTILEWSFDCVRLGMAGVQVLGPEEGGGVPDRPIDSEEQTDEDYDDSARSFNYLSTDTNSILFRKPKQNDLVNR